ncbi:S-layer homology domain-containing protein [Paenibacillus agri]|uniref:S-layer homology domain-containing protein n=1 Tax=Paenibacillus agri TaxID=2744309 RepID=A0A850EEN2_9BACL|nr:S-layer homology domain-containing protein [Paenibacillus agri]NUU59635.1 S-layer homology domain-containing protein [Paenibacillus agri]
MTLKKKLAVSTLAVSLAAASFAGIPFSSEGLAKQFGFTGVAAASAVTQDTVKDKIKKLYAELDEAGRKNLLAYQDEASKITTTQFENIFSAFLNNEKLGLSADNKDTLYTAFVGVSSVVYDVYDGDYSKLKEIRTNADNIKLLKEIAAKADVADLTFDDVVDFIFGENGVEATLRSLVSSKTKEELIAIATNPAGQEELFNEAIAKVLNTRTGSTGAATVSQVVYNLNITSADVKATLKTFNTEIKSAKPAVQSLVLAYIRAFGLGNGGPVDPGTPGTPGTNPGGGDSSPGTPAVTVVVKDGGVYDVSKLVSIVDGKATLKLVDADVLKAFDALVAAAKAAGKEAKDLTLTLDLGTVNAKTVEVPLSKAIIDAAKAKGIANIAVTFNGLTVTIPVGQFDAAIALTVSNADDAVVTSVTKLKLASSVYEFGLTVDGKAVTTFKQPITLKLPLKNTEGLDKELLSVTKLVYNSLQFQGGVLDGDYIVEPRDTFSSYAVLENKVSFSDIASVQAWAGRQIQVVAAKGAIEGVGDGKFAPKSNVTRAEFAKMLIRGLNLENSSATQSFSDVRANDWFAPYVAVAAEKGIINGRGDNKFDPNATITRAEMATMISRALKSVKDIKDTASLSALSAFSDAAKISSTLKEGVAFAASHDLVIGNAGKFNPNNSATRAEAAVIIYRTINFK